MYRVSVDGVEKTVESREILRKWILRGRLSPSDSVTDLETGEEIFIGDLLEDQDIEIAADDGDPDPSRELENKLDYISSKPPEAFSEEEYTALTAYLAIAKKQDRDGLVDWETFAAFRKKLKKLEKAAYSRKFNESHVSKKAKQTERPKQSKAIPTGPVQVEWSGPQVSQPSREDLLRGKSGGSDSKRRSSLPRTEKKRRADWDARTQNKTQSHRPTDGNEPVALWHKPFVIIIALLLFAPAGIVLLWTAPRHSAFGNPAWKILLTILFGASFFKQHIADYITDGGVAVVKEAGSNMEIGAGFQEQPAWKITDTLESYPVGATVYYLAKDLSCDKTQIEDKIDVTFNEETSPVRGNRFDWQAGHDLYTHSIVPETPGTYRVRIYCGENVLATGEFEVRPQ